MIIKKLTLIKSFLIKIILLKVINGELCVYNTEGSIKFDNYNLTDIEYIYPDLEYFIGDNPFNTYFGNCSNEKDLVNIYGIHASKRKYEKFNRDFQFELLEKSYFKDDCTRCNLLTGKEPESNPYNRELTGLVNPNKVERWKAVESVELNMDSNPVTMSKLYTFDDSYNISIQKSIFEKEPLILNKNDQYSDNENENYGTMISKIIEESIIKSVFNKSRETWEDDIMENISNINEEYNKRKWNFDRAENTLCCNNDEQDIANILNTCSSFDNSFIDNYRDYMRYSSGLYYFQCGSTSIYVEPNKSRYRDGINNFEEFVEGPHYPTNSRTDEYRHYTYEEFSNFFNQIKSENRKSNFNYFLSEGTSENLSIGNPERNHSYKDKTESISISELLTKLDVNANIISNSIDRIKPMNKTKVEINLNNIGSTIGNNTLNNNLNNTLDVTLNTTLTTLENDSLINKFKSKIFEEGYDINKSGNKSEENGICDLVIYKKITKIFNVFSCTKTDKNLKYMKGLEVTDIDFNLLNNINNYNGTDLDEKDLLGYEDYLNLHLQWKCYSKNNQDIIFKSEENIFVPTDFKQNFKNDLNDTDTDTVLHYKVLPSYLELASKNGYRSIKSIQNSSNKKKSISLVNNKGNIKLSKGNEVYFNTETGKISKNAKFRISKNNHLEVYVKNEDIFGPDENNREYASEFANVDYSVNPGLNNILNENVKEPENEPELKLEKKYLSKLKNDGIDVESLFGKSEEICKAALLYCNCQCFNEFDYDNKANCQNQIKYIDEINNTVTTYKEITNHIDAKIKEEYYQYEQTICTHCGKFNYTNEDIAYICNKNNQKSIQKQILNLVDEKCNCQEYEQCQYIFEMKNSENMEKGHECDKYDDSSISSLCNKECSSNKIEDKTKNKRSFIDYSNNKNLNDGTSKSNINVEEVVVWSSVRPEHQHLPIGWTGDIDFGGFSYLVLNSHSHNDSRSYDGMTLYDANGIPIWMLDISHPKRNNKYLDSNGYYLPFKYGYPFRNERITNHIPERYAKKKYPYLTIPKNVEYKGNTLYFGGCNNNLKSPNENGNLEGLISQNGRFRLILKEDGNLIFKDHKVTIWESKTSDLWQGKAPYKLIIGKDGVMRILNKLDYPIMSTKNKPVEKYNTYDNYRLEILNAGTFRIVDKRGNEVWNMWRHTAYHNFNIHLEEEIYPSCTQTERNPNLPFLSTTTEDNSIIRVGEQLVNRFTEEEFKQLTRNGDDYTIKLNKSNDDFNFENNGDNISARLLLSGFHLEYQKSTQNLDNLEEDKKIIYEYFSDLQPITDRNPSISYGKLNNDGSFSIFDNKDNELFTTGIKGNVCDNRKCFYYMFISRDNDGYIKIVKRNFIKNDRYIDSLISTFTLDKSLLEMNINKNNQFSLCHASSNLKQVIHCGPRYNNKRCPRGECCSESGVCGFNLDFCGKGCQSEFGYCIPKEELKNPVCNDCLNCSNCKNCSKCGNRIDILLCPQVCIKNQTELPVEMCTTNDELDYSNSAQLEYICKKCNKCINCKKHPEIAKLYPGACKKKSSIISTDGKCGPRHGYKVCPNNECCNKNGHCVFDAYQCAYECLPEYGFCLKESDYNSRCNKSYSHSRYDYCDYTPSIALSCNVDCISEYDKYNSINNKKYSIHDKNYQLETELYCKNISENICFDQELQPYYKKN